MRKYIVYVERKKVNEFEVEAENKESAENTVRDLLNRTSILSCKTIDMVPTEICISAKKMKKKKRIGRLLNNHFKR